MLTPRKFHTNLIGSDPTPEQLRLYTAAPTAHGYANEKPDRDRFVATFILGLYLTYDQEAGKHRSVPFAVPHTLDAWVIQTINSVLEEIKARRIAQIPRREDRQAGNRLIVDSVSNLEIGSRVFSIATEPVRWVAFGYDHDTYAPAWLKAGLL